MKIQLFAVGVGILMIAGSLAALASGTQRAIDTQCYKRCICTGSPCRGITHCQNGLGEWTKCCNWCVV